MRKHVPTRMIANGGFRAEPLEPDRARRKKEHAILVMSRRADLRERLSDMLTDMGFVGTADGFDGALEILGGICVDIVISDIRMDCRDDGIRLLEWVTENRPQTKVVLIGDATDIPDKARAMADRVLGDPEDIAAIRRSL